MTHEKQSQMDSLVTTEWLNEHLDDPDLVVLDCTVNVEPDPETGYRIVTGRGDYDLGHIAGARFADLLVDLSATDKPDWWVPMPTPERFSAAMGALGVSDDSRVVLYDGNNSMWAARVWWMLRWVGFDNATLLDGGSKLWIEEDRPLSAESPTPSVRTLTPRVHPEVIADRDEVFEAIGENDICLIHTLGAETYKAQHIPSSINIDAAHLLDESGRYRPHDELTALFTGDRDARAITYCGGGVAASSNAFIMARLGFTDVAVYAASMQEWTADSADPMVVGTGRD